MPRTRAFALSLGAVALGLSTLSCAEPETLEGPKQKLSEYGFFVGDIAELAPAEGVIPYAPVSPLFSDFTRKDRFLWLPDGEQVEFDDGEDWIWPVGSILIKNFSFDHDRRDPSLGFRVVETRLLIFEESEDGVQDWVPYTYVWDEDQQDATFLDVGDRRDVEFIDENGDAAEQTYIIPSLEHCASCHERDDETRLLGPVTAQLNTLVERDGVMVNQLSWLADQGVIANAPEDPSAHDALVDPLGDAPVEARARAYLHANCGHCHREGGDAGVSGLRYVYTEQEPIHLGVCKPPAAAGPGTGGHDYGIVPGDPDASVVIFRMSSLEPEIKMPELSNRVLNPEGIQVVRDWISAMDPPGCEPDPQPTP